MNTVMRRGDYRASEGYFPVPPEYIDWSTHIYEVPGTESPVRLSIHRNRTTDGVALAHRVRETARRSYRRVVLVRDERVVLSFGEALAFAYTFEKSLKRRIESQLIFTLGETTFVASVQADEVDASLAQETMNRFVSTVTLHRSDEEEDS